MTAHASDWGNSSNPHRRGGKLYNVGFLVLGDDPNIVQFLPYKTYDAGVYCSCPNQPEPK